MEISIEKYRVIGGGACPEQYDVFDGETRIGYMRMRHGRFHAETLPNEKIVYAADPNGDGSFIDDEERQKYLIAAVRAMDAALRG